MHPAYSVIFFTTASGAGYGLLALLGGAAALGWLPPDRALGFAGLGLALAMITAGLLASTAHLGRPKRAWRAFSQWRSSWLSREGVLAVATYVPAAVLGLGWALIGRTDGVFAAAAALAAALALVTVYATGMIYQSLPTIRQWHQPLTSPIYLSLALATGGVLFATLLAAFRYPVHEASLLAACLIATATALKLAYWHAIDESLPLASPGSATGLGYLGPVRQLDPPHSQPNFVMREMGYTIARKHARRLRLLVLVTLAGVSVAGCLVASLPVPGFVCLLVLVAAVVSAAVGVVTERWLFFAEARHVVMNFYGGSG